MNNRNVEKKKAITRPIHARGRGKRRITASFAKLGPFPNEGAVVMRLIWGANPKRKIHPMMKHPSSRGDSGLV
jgi:hypothetical protein